jgi:Ser/Thr protein kinase RdoA (MazF antagonist)
VSREAATVLREHYARSCPQFELAAADGAGINSRNWIVSVDGKPRFVLKHGPCGQVTRLYVDFARLCPLLPPLVASDQGAACVQGEWRLLEYRPGQNQPDAAAAGRALATLQRAIRKVPGEIRPSGNYDYLAGKELERALERCPELPCWYAEIRDLESTPGLPRGWVHHDYHPANVLFDGNEVSAILDMDSIVTDFRMQAVAFAASRFGDAERFTAAYQAEDALTKVEISKKDLFVKREAVRRINWILRDPSGKWDKDLAKHLEVLR